MSTQSQQTNEASYVNAIKDQTVGAIKQVIGNVLGNPQMELEGKAQKIHGLNEYEYAKSFQAGETEPEKFQQAYQSENPGSSVTPSASADNEPSKISGLKDQVVGAVKETLGSATNNQNMELKGKAQNVHGRNEAEFVKAQKQGLSEPEHFGQPREAQGQVVGDTISSVSALKDRAVGSLKETLGSATGNLNTELAGKAQNLHGRNEAEFAKAQRQGLSEPEHYAHGKKPEPAQGEVVAENPTTLGAIKDKTLGSIKEMVGSLTGNQNLELKGLAQNIHGRNEAEFVKAEKQGLSEPEHYAHGRKTTEQAQGQVLSDEPSRLSALKDQAIGTVKETLGSTLNNQDMELKGKAQNIHGRNEAEFAKAQQQGLSEPEHFVQGSKNLEPAKGEVVSDEASTLSGWKDQALGAVKGTIGSVTNNQDLELKGKAQQVHGRNEAEFAKAHKQGLTEPQHFGEGNTQQAQGQVEGDSVSSLSAMKDRAIGSLKETLGSATGNLNTELAGKAQNLHGRNEAEFAKAQRQGLSEPEHYAHGTRTCQTPESEVVSQEPSTLSGMKDQAIGAVKESIGSATNNQKMEIEGLAQKLHGSNQCAVAKNTINA